MVVLRPETAGKWENGVQQRPGAGLHARARAIGAGPDPARQDRPGQAFALLSRLIAGQRAGQAAAGIPFGYLARLQRASAAGPPAPDPGPSGIIDR